MTHGLSKAEVIEVIRGIIKEIEPAIDTDSIDETTDILELEMDSLDIMQYLFEIDEKLGREIPDDVFVKKKLSVIGNLIQYLENEQKS
ncbi:MAG TPA: acyl carrier protein [Syntrophales bacterium]|nr:acyl carrier protein [Syntrophales bacterium]